MASQAQEPTTLPARLETLLEMTRQLSQILPLDTLLSNMAHACASLLNSDSVGIRVVEGDSLVLAGVCGDALTAMATPRIRIGESLTGIVVATGESLLVADPANDHRLTPAHRAAYQSAGYRAFLGVPLRVGDQVLGALSIRTQREEGFSAEDVSIATAFAAQAAIGLENARLYQQSEARAENLRALSRLTRLIISAEGGTQVCQAVARAATTLLGAATTRVSVADPVARVLRTEGGFSLDPEIEFIVTEVPTVRYGEGLSGRIVETRRPEYIPDIADVPQLKNRRLSSVARLRGFAGLPLIADDEIVGVLAMFFHERRSFSAEERELMALLADQAAIAIRNARLRQALRTRQAHLETLLEVSRQLSKIQPVESLLTTIAEACGRLLDSDTVGFRRVDGDELILAGSWGDARNVMITERLRMGESLAGRVAVGGEPLVVTDLANDPRVTSAHRASFHSRGYQALLVIPVKVGERVIGVLSVLSRRDEGFSAEDVMIATAFAAKAAVALENSRLYQEIQRAYDELSQTQDQLAQASKMEAVGHLAGGVAHDFNNLLMVIMGRADVLLRGLDEKHSMRPAIQEITRTAQRAADLTHQLLAFSRKQVLKPAVLDLNSVIANLTEMLRRLIGEDIDLVAVLDPLLGRAKADLGQIEQIVMNLAVNARDAMPHGGQLTLETANVELDAEYARMHVGVRPGSYVMLALSDTGVGMDSPTQARIFEPFFTTKGPRNGTGLGLAMVYGIVKQSGGNIGVYSEPGQGTTFKIYLPKIDAPIDGGLASPPPPSPSYGRETVLVVEDEEGVRALVRDILEQSGYTVLEASHGAQALETSERHPGPIHLVLTDVVMPEMSGPELVQRLATLRPASKVLFMSGYTANAVVHRGALGSETEFLQKPFTAATLTRKVREILDMCGAR
jgi:signal transduction histidine kinase